ncbi:hypothetical protein [Pseudodesulfovibrio sp. JC047]|uniref:hypothetical protein n=1 Tax=Pseudodesulfovibrio sp. JC047 TaxID=2683199 RepID=UPI001EF38A30|nr:hypothetical protein [Pseudodesulfovibrio sp. JC047]
MFDFGKSLLTMAPNEQKQMLDTATPRQRNAVLELGIGIKSQNQRQQSNQQKRDAYHDLDRLNSIVEKENEAHDFFGKGLTDWQKNVTGNRPSTDANILKKQFDDYEHDILSDLPKGGKRHGALSETLPKIKKEFLQQGHQFILDKFNEHSRSVLDKGLQRLAQGALGAKDEKDIQSHDDAAFNLINKYVLSEAKFDEKDADVMYDKYLGYAGVDREKIRVSENDDVPGVKSDFKIENAEMLAENDIGTDSDAGGEEEAEGIPNNQKELNKNEADVETGQDEENAVPQKIQEADNKEEPEESEGQDNEYNTFLNDLGARESSNDYKSVNQLGYLGKYQMGKLALIDAGYKDKDGNWTGKNGVNSKEDFLNSPEAQENSFDEYKRSQWRDIEHRKLDQYIGKEVGGIEITASGLLAGAHLRGVAGGIKKYLESDGKDDPTDANGTCVSEYLRKFKGYEVPYAK